jgi:DNA polymerase I
MRKVCSYDTETTGLNAYSGDKIFSYCIGDFKTGEVEVWRVDGDERSRGRALVRLQKFFDNTSIVKVGHNFKFDLGMTLQLGIKIPEETEWHDTMIMAKMRRNDEVKYTLDYLAWKYGKYRCKEDALVEAEGKRLGGYQFVDHKLMERYQKADGERTLLLYGAMIEELQADQKLYEDYLVEIEMCKVAQEMEQHGIRYSQRHADELRVWMKQEMRSTYSVIMQNSSVRHGFNPNSHDQVSELLFKNLKLPVVKLTGTGLNSVDKDTFAELKRQVKLPVLDAILKYRSYSHGTSTLNGYEKFVDGKGYIHPVINTLQAATGRQSCEHPNLQNVQKEIVETNPYPIPMRRCFICDPDAVMSFTDYAGIQMRLIIDATNEPELLEILKRRGDVHHPTLECFIGAEEAARLRDNDKAAYKPLRNVHKNVGFCFAFGGGDAAVADTLQKPLLEVMPGCLRYRQRFPRIAGFCRFMIDTVKRQGFIETPFKGRKLYIPRSEAYVGSNYLIQGTEAQIVKRACIRIRKLIMKKYSGSVNMIISIHDEIVNSVKRRFLPYFNDFKKDMTSLMVDMPEIHALLDAEWKMTTTTWDKAVEVKDEL